MNRSVQIVPSPYDILGGRGRGNFQSMGNRRFLSIIAAFKTSYKNARNTDKPNITRLVYDMATKEIDGVYPRFLKRQNSRDRNSPWILMTESEARAKVAHTLRESKAIINTDPSDGSVRGKPSVVSPSSSPEPSDKPVHPHVFIQEQSPEPQELYNSNNRGCDNTANLDIIDLEWITRREPQILDDIALEL